AAATLGAVPHVMDHRALFGAALDEQGVEGGEELADLTGAVFVEPQRRQGRAETVEDDHPGVHLAELSRPARPDRVVDEVEGGELAAQRADVDPLGVLDALVSVPASDGADIQLVVEDHNGALDL